QTSIKQFRYYKQLADKAMAQVADASLFVRSHADENSIAIIVQHLSGNMRSRWTNIFTEDGEKPWRHRDSEFEPALQTKADMIASWESGWQVLFDTLKNLNEIDLPRTIYIRNEGLTVQDAILRQLCHYSYHCGQIVYICKTFAGTDWQTLSIARNDSDNYNKQKASEKNTGKHYLDSLLDDK
ncbi:MAG: DUF1572 family protein, partial [Saprospiraceae bacterium]